MKRIKLSRKEKQIEDALLKGEYVDVGHKTLRDIAQAVYGRRKDAVLNLRVNRQDLESIKHKAGKLSIRYQTFISEILHRVAQG